MQVPNVDGGVHNDYVIGTRAYARKSRTENFIAPKFSRVENGGWSVVNGGARELEWVPVGTAHAHEKRACGSRARSHPTHAEGVQVREREPGVGVRRDGGVGNESSWTAPQGD